MPFTTLPPGSDNPRDLWKWLAAYEDKTGGERAGHRPQRQPVATASCSRSSNPLTGTPIDREYAETRAKWERLYEATQIKGDGETHPVPVA